MEPQITGKSAGWPGPVAEYTRNQGSCGRKRIVFIGASYKFVHRVVRDIILAGGFDECEIILHDIDPVPLNIVADLLERMARQQKTRLVIRRTLDPDEALKDAGAVILSITTGGRESDFRSFEVCAKYGIPVGIGDTLGPAALARNLRTIPVVLGLARRMERLCPRAILCNFTNPMSCITGALARHSSLQTFGLCHSSDELFRYFAAVYGVKKGDVEMELAGVNHQSFVARLLIQGEDRTKDILRATQASGAKLEDSLLAAEHPVRLQQDLYKILGAWPSCGETHLAEFYGFFYTPRRLDQLGLRSQCKQVFPGRTPFGRTPCPQIIQDWAYGPEPVGDLHLLTEEHAHELLWASFTGEPYTRSLNILNTGPHIKNLPEDACVEVMATVAGLAVSVTPVELPTAVHALVARWCAIHDLSIRAAVDCSRELARQALLLDPHVTDLYDIEPLLEDFLQALEPWLPRAWFR